MRSLLICLLIVLPACSPASNGAERADDWTYVEVVSETGVHRFTVEIADEPAEQRRGLMYRQSLPEDAGMLFLYEEAEILSYYMRNTYIPLDIIYIDTEGRIVSIARETEPLSERSLFSAAPAIAVLEVNGGLSDQLGFGEGDLVRHPFFEELRN